LWSPINAVNLIPTSDPAACNDIHGAHEVSTMIAILKQLEASFGIGDDQQVPAI
jgi:hypothetical protein